MVFLLAFPVYLMTPKHHKIDEQKVRIIAAEYKVEEAYWRKVNEVVIKTLLYSRGWETTFTWRGRAYNWR